MTGRNRISREQPLPVGTELAGHVVERVLGQGGFGITYRVRETVSGSAAALKEFFPADDAERVDATTVRAKPGHLERFEMGYRAFLEEARTLNALPAQRGLVRIQGAFEKHATVYALMDFIDGEPLDKATRIVLRKHAAIPLPLLQDLTESMIAALRAIHRVGVLHRDVKPGNIMIRRDGQPVLIDFGAARPMVSAKNLASMFSRRYAAIEQFPTARTGYRARDEDGPAIDIFALSVVLYELVSQSLPPDAEERFATLRKSGRDPYLPVRANMERNRVAARYPAALLDAIDAGCRLLPGDRPGTANDLAARLSEVIDMAKARPAPLDTKPAMPPQRTRHSGSDGMRITATGRPTSAKQRRPGLSGAWQMAAIILTLAGASVAFGLMTQ